MPLFRKLAAAWNSLFHKDRFERDMDDELRHFLDAAVQQKISSGMTRPEALRTARELLPDLILLDISMPGKDGLETTHLLRQALPKTKILIMSQHDPVQFSPSALKAGAHAYVDKSRLGTDLLPAIESVARTSAAELASPDPSPSSRTPSSPAARPQEKRNEESALPFAVAFKIDFSPNLKSEI